jgi:hypothetical protein
MDIANIQGLADLTQELLKELRSSRRLLPDPLFNQLWSVVEQELLRYSCMISPDCEAALRELVSDGVKELNKTKPTRKSKYLAETSGHEVVVSPYLHRHLENQPVRYIIYGVQTHRSRREELAEVALRTVVLTMTRIAKEGESDELTIQTFNSVKTVLCPLWPFWKPEDC